jgi:DNA polymerase III delta prime subunit
MAALQLVYAAAPADEPGRRQLAAQLRAFLQKEAIVEWHEGLLPAGADVAEERQRAWREADILLLLLSADYFAANSPFEALCQEALQRQRQGTLLLIPILLRPYQWEWTELAGLPCLPRDGQPLSLAKDQEAAFFLVAQEICQQIRQQYALSTPAAHVLFSTRERDNRQLLLKRVRQTWIEGMLERSLRQAVWVDLHLQDQPDAVENPWHLMVQELDRVPRPLPPGTSILQVFEQADEELLILGEPGSGKTTLLLYLARALLDLAERDESRRIPVIVNLASWAQQRLPLEQWLVSELKRRYQIPIAIGQSWIAADQIFPLLDGLDEVAEAARPACVQAILSYMHNINGHIPLVLCCRSEAYQALAVQLPLQYAVMLLPFTDDQIDMYLSSVSGQFDVLRKAFAEDKDLFELARRPLMLSIFALALRGLSEQELAALEGRQGTGGQRADYPTALFRYYVQRMLSRRAELRSGTPAQIQRWLSYLARQLREQQETLCTVEDLQPDWLPEHVRPWYRRGMILVYSLIFGLCGLFFGLAFGLAYGSVYHFASRLGFGLELGQIIGISGGLCGGLCFGLTFSQHYHIQPAEEASWSARAAGRGLRLGVVGGLGIGSIAGLLAGLLAGGASGLLVGIAVLLVVSGIGAFVNGLTPQQLSDRTRLVPNEGIWRSGKRGLMFVISAVLIMGLAAGLTFGIAGRSILDLIYGWLFGIVLGSGAGAIFGVAFGRIGGRTGIAAFLQHFVLRFYLWRLNLLPWHLIDFLNEATEHLLLYRVGGSYIFVHRLLRDVLAEDRPAEQ